jgi:vacuolar-type H+-ATPase subunit I/STV1
MDIILDLNSKEYQHLAKYCELNKLVLGDIVKKSYLEGFMIEKYGLLNGSESTKEVEVIKEVIKYVEVPVVEEKEVIKIEYVEVEKIVEVIKEVPVTNLDNICDKTYVDELLKKIEELENQPPKVVEVVVEKEGDDSSLKPKLEALQNTLMKIRQENIEKDKKILEYEKTIEDIQRLQENKQAVYLNGSNLSNKLNN